MEKKIANLFRIPKVSSTSIESSVIGVFDASGSMSSAWPYAARSWNEMTKDHPSKFMISFSTAAKARELPLLEDIHKYDCGSTNICAGFHVLNELMKDPKVQSNVTIVFVSDGGDDDTSTLAKRMTQLAVAHGKTINFISVGVGSGFPTFVAMSLREIYHNGASSLPPLFLVDNVCDTATWNTQFGLMKNYIGHTAKVPVTPAVKRFPWQDEIAEVNERSWVYSHEETITVNSSTPVLKAELLSADEFIDIAKGWLGELQLISIRGGEAKNAAIAALDLLNDWRTKFIDGATAKGASEKLTFNQRMQKKFENTVFYTIQAVLKQIKNLAEDEVLSSLTEAEAAKRLAIGTSVGKHHNAAMNLRGITVDDYLNAREYFIDIYSKNTLSAESDQETSVISLQNQKDVFREEDLIAGLKNCPSQYDLVEEFPIVGHAIEIKRSDGAMINPFMVRVLNVAKHHKVVDSVSLQAAGNKLVMSIGEGEEETVNAVLPLFSKKDADLKPFITSKLFNILMTFNVMGNADTCFETAYLALIANACQFLLTQTPSGWRDGVLELIGSTIEIVSASNEGFKKYAQALIDTPRIAVVTENPAITTKCEDLSKPICVLFYLVWSKQVTDAAKIREILDAIAGELFGRALPGDAVLNSFFNVHLPDGAVLPTFLAEEESLTEKLSDVTAFFTKYELKSEIEKQVSALPLKLDFKVSTTLATDKLVFLSQGKLSLKNLDKVFGYFLPGTPLLNETDYINLLSHANKYKNSYERNTATLENDSAAILEKMSSEKENEIIKANKIVANVYSVLLKKFEDFITKTHFKVAPMTRANLKKYCDEHGLDVTKFVFNKASNLLTNACMAQECPYYMKLQTSLAQHLESDIGRCPALHKTIKLNTTLSSEEILAKVISGECLTRVPGAEKLLTPEMLDKTTKQREVYLSLINAAKEMYQLKDIAIDDEAAALEPVKERR